MLDDILSDVRESLGIGSDWCVICGSHFNLTEDNECACPSRGYSSSGVSARAVVGLVDILTAIVGAACSDCAWAWQSGRIACAFHSEAVKGVVNG